MFVKKDVWEFGAIRFAFCVLLISYATWIELQFARAANRSSLIDFGIRNDRKFFSGRCVPLFSCREEKREIERDGKSHKVMHERESITWEHLMLANIWCGFAFCVLLGVHASHTYLSPNIGLILVSFEKEMTHNSIILHTNPL